MLKTTTQGVTAAVLCAALLMASLAPTPAEAGRKPKPAAEADADDAAGAEAMGCSLYGGGVVDAMGQSAAYMFIGQRPMCGDADRKQRFCAALQTREGYDLVREHSDAAEQAQADAKALPEEMRATFLQQHPRHSFEPSFGACGLKLDGVRAKLVAQAEATIQAGKASRQDDELNFLRRESPATVEAIWKRECAGRVQGRSYGELGIGIDFRGNAVYDIFCKRTSKANKAGAPGLYGG